MQAPGLRAGSARLQSTVAPDASLQQRARHRQRCQHRSHAARLKVCAAGDEEDGAAGNEAAQSKRDFKYRGPRMSSEELRARLLRNAQRTDAARAGTRWSNYGRPDGSQPLGSRGPSGPGWQPPEGVAVTDSGILGGASIAPADGSAADVASGGFALSGDEALPPELSSSRVRRRYGTYSSSAARRAVELAASPGGGMAEQRTAKVTFWLQFHVEWGQRLRVIGSHPKLGAWDLGRAPELCWNEGDRWSVTLDLPTNRIVEYKFVVLSSDGTHASAWQTGNNSVLAVQAGEETVEVFDNWMGQPGAIVRADGQESTRETRLTTWAEGLAETVESQRHELRRARMELVAAQEEARAAQEEARGVRMELAASEAERARLVAAARTAELASRALRAQLAEAGAAFRAAMATAQGFLQQAEVDGAVNEEVEAIAKQAVDLILPVKPPSSELPSGSAEAASAHGGSGAGATVAAGPQDGGEVGRNGAAGAK